MVAECCSREATVWFFVGLVLGGALPASAQLPSQPLAPDHLGCVVDDGTLEALAESEFLAGEFAHARPGGAVTAAGTAWSNYTIYGELTYVEAIGRGIAASLGAQVGDCMIALNPGESGVLAPFADYLGQVRPDWNPFLILRELQRGPDAVPWYYTLDFNYSDGFGGLALWLKEYHPDFKHLMTPDRYPVPGDVSRERDAPPVAHHPNKYFQDVTGVVVAVSPDRRAQLEELLTMVGFKARPDRDGRIYMTDEFELEFLPVQHPDDYTIREIRLSLTRPFPSAAGSYPLGTMRLEFTSDTSVVLHFTRPGV